MNTVARVLAKLPEAARAPFRAQAKIHNMMVHGSPTIEQLEELAVLPGAEPTPEDVPAERWSWHPDGYFVRYSARGYRRSIVQVVVPIAQTIQRDHLGRIVSVTDADGWRIETTYRDDLAPLTVANQPGLRGYAFKSITLISPDPDNPGQVQTHEIDNDGWTLVGEVDPDAPIEQATSPYGGQSRNGWRYAMLTDEPMGGLRFAAETGDFGSPDDLLGRLDRAKSTAKEIKKNQARLKDFKPSDNHPVDDLTDLKHYHEGLKRVKKGDMEGEARWFHNHLSRVTRAWQWASDKLAGKEDEAQNEPKFKSNDVATPGDRGRQRLGQSKR